MELAWSNLLAMANAMTGAPWVFFVLYIYLAFELTCFQVGKIMAYLYFIRWLSSNIFIYIFDQRERLHSLFLSTCYILSALSCILIYNLHSTVHWSLFLFSLTFFGVFYLSIGILIESVILKSWGDYRMYFYGHHRTWSEWTLLFLLGLIGLICFLFDREMVNDNDDKQQHLVFLLRILFTTMVCIGALIMCIIATFKTYSLPSDPTDLGLTPSTPWLQKNAATTLPPSDFMLWPSQFAPYKPYSLFGEPLSHISEEDASMIQRIMSQSSLGRELSHHSTATSTTSPSIYSTTSPMPPSPLPPSSQQQPNRPIYSDANNNSHITSYGTIYSSTPNMTIPTRNDYNNAFLNPSLYNHIGYDLENRRPSNASFSYDPSVILNEDEDDDEINNNNMNINSPISQQQQKQQQQLQLQQPFYAHSVNPNIYAHWESVPSYELALFSFIPPEIPSIAILPILLSYLFLSTTSDTSSDAHSIHRSSSHSNQQQQQQQQQHSFNFINTTNAVALPGPLLINPPPLDKWKLCSLQFNMFILGCVSALMHVFLFVYFYAVLNISIVFICLSGVTIFLSKILLLTTVRKWIHNIHYTFMTILIHSILILCNVTYLWLIPNHLFTIIAALLLPFLQGIIFYLAWLITSNRINTLVWSDQQRIIQRSIMSTLFSCIGPIFGTLLAGLLIDDNGMILKTNSFSLVYQLCVGLLTLSFVLSWVWCEEE